MPYSYDATKAQTEAREWVRLKVGDTSEDRHQLEDEEIEALLNDHGLTATSDPASNRSNVHKAAADCARAIAARLGKDSEIAITEVGQVKNTAASFYLKLAQSLEEEAEVVKPEDLEPTEEIDSLDYDTDRWGRDTSEYVGDVI